MLGLIGERQDGLDLLFSRVDKSVFEDWLLSDGFGDSCQ